MQISFTPPPSVPTIIRTCHKLNSEPVPQADILILKLKRKLNRKNPCKIDSENYCRSHTLARKMVLSQNCCWCRSRPIRIDQPERYFAQSRQSCAVDLPAVPELLLFANCTDLRPTAAPEPRPSCVASSPAAPELRLIFRCCIPP